MLLTAKDAVIVVVLHLPKDSSWLSLKPVFWLESIAVVAFGISWLVKGEAIFKDQPNPASA
jgi:hypothetical protein